MNRNHLHSDEMKALERNKDKWCAGNEGKYLAIRGDVLAAVLDEPEAAVAFQEQHPEALVWLVLSDETQDFLRHFNPYGGPAKEMG